jgi:hypothetical protein
MTEDMVEAWRLRICAATNSCTGEYTTLSRVCSRWHGASIRRASRARHPWVTSPKGGLADPRLGMITALLSSDAPDLSVTDHIVPGRSRAARRLMAGHCSREGCW